ncbi:DUF2149 domain-containing protein [Desulfofundulus sp. TPOSR]|uniref:DUF2149 domain-containing protein n=1 Tax=Desulfofundulus sp. TPOSR TaxID=2714340 RepID=UPI0014095FB9|nr:DUF2149 domain-containing protein [Desulfofundulus sp. TPOSR]NHM27597.1 DUF2149 domain-containing protein [Desulfofundulus sp. TPOSR]
MLFRRRRRERLSADEIDPLGGLANLIDVMLVFCCGLMVALVLSWNLQNIIFAKVKPEEKQRLMQSIQRVINVERGKELKQMPQIEQGGGFGFQEMGTVYQDPKTGKLIMIEKNSQ